jgi:hypothetical protein
MNSVHGACDNTSLIVEMAWGRPSRAIVYEYAEDGGLVGVTLVCSRQTPDPVRRRLCCSRELWYAVLALGRQYDWLPTGTAPAPRSVEAWEQRGWFDDGYDPDTWLYAKQLFAADAVELADALERALRDPAACARMRVVSTPLRAAQLVGPAQSDPIHDCLSAACLRELIAFLRKGPCVFAWADLPKTNPDK